MTGRDRVHRDRRPCPAQIMVDALLARPGMRDAVKRDTAANRDRVIGRDRNVFNRPDRGGGRGA